MRFHGLCLGLIVAALLMAGCSRTETPPPPATDGASAVDVAAIRAQRDAVLQQRDSLAPTKAEWSMGTTKSTLTGYYEGDTLRLIEESMDMGEFGSATATFVYSADGKLAAYSERKQAKVAGGAMEPTETELFFGPSGGLAEGSRKVAGEGAALTGFEEQGVKMHARELELALAEARSGGKK